MSEDILRAGWPKYDPQLAREEALEIPVQVNGRLRGKVKVPAGAGEADVVTQAKTEPSVAAHVAGKQVKKIIFVPDKLVNIVVA